MPTPLDVVLGQSDRKPWKVTVSYEIEIEVWAGSREDAIKRAEKEMPWSMYEGDGEYARSAERAGIVAFLKDD